MSLTFDPDYIDFGELGAVPATPSAGNVRVFADASDKKVYIVDSTGAVTELGGGGFTSFDVGADSGTDQSVADGQVLTFTGSNGITTTIGGTREVTISGSAFVQSITLAGGSGTPQTINNGNTITIAGSGGITTSASATDTVTVDGSAFMQSFTVAGGAGSSQTISNSNTLSILGSNGITTTGSATDTITIDGLEAGRLIKITSGSIAGSASTTISSISSSYEHLELHVIARTSSASEEFMTLRVGNGGLDTTGANYSRTALNVINATLGGFSDVSSANLLTAATLGASGGGNRYSLFIVRFDFYAGAEFKQCHWTIGGAVSSAVADQKHATGRGYWLSTSVIDTIGIIGTSNFATGSRYILYGIKA